MRLVRNVRIADIMQQKIQISACVLASIFAVNCELGKAQNPQRVSDTSMDESSNVDASVAVDDSPDYVLQCEPHKSRQDQESGDYWFEQTGWFAKGDIGISKGRTPSKVIICGLAGNSNVTISCQPGYTCTGNYRIEPRDCVAATSYEFEPSGEFLINCGYESESSNSTKTGFYRTTVSIWF